MNSHKSQYLKQKYEIENISPHGGFFLKKVIGDTLATDVTSYEWLFIQIDLSEGTAQFKIDGDVCTVHRGVYGFFAPPFSIYYCHFTGQADMRVFFSTLPKPRELPDLPIIFRWHGQPFEGSFKEVIASLNAADEFVYAKTDQTHSGLAQRIKKKISERFETNSLLSQLAYESGISAAHFSRVFKEKYGLTAVEFRSRLRSVCAVYKLLQRKTANIIDIAFDTGYSDLSRFNKQFKHHLKMVPSSVRKLQHN
jgi:AraC-like DNA-binding protein